MTSKHESEKMKIAKRVVALLLFSSLFLMSCETLDFPNPNAPILEDISAQTLVTGAEAGMRTDFAFYLRVAAVLSREGYYFEQADPRYTDELLPGVPDPGGPFVNRPWNARYRTIANCNILLDKASALPAAERAGVEGFAKTIMAYQLLLNLNYMDENGIKLDFTGNLAAPFVTKAEAFTRIDALLDEANTAMAAAGSAFPFVLSSGFAGFNTPAGFAKFNRALKARTAIYQKKYNDALTALNASFLDVNAPLELGVYHVYGTGLADDLNPIFEVPTAAVIRLFAHPTFQTAAESGDRRFSSKVRIRPEPTTFRGLTSNLGVTVANNSTDHFPIIRNEELILIRAEANIGLGNLATAQTDINLIRAAAGLGPVTLDAANAVDRLLHERRYSLFMEGHYWIDLRRYNRLTPQFVPIDRQGDAIISQMPRPENEVGG